MSNHNKDYRRGRFETNTVDDITEEELLEIVEDEPEIEVEEVVETTSEPMYGKVFGTDRLNVRVNPSIDADVVCRINKDDVVLIDEKLSTDDWYSICTENGMEGFCMKEFISQFFKTES